MDSKRIRNGMIYFLLVVALGAFLYIVLSNQGNNISASVSIAEVASLVRGGNVQEIRVDGDEVFAYTGGKVIGSRKETGIGLIETLENLGVTEDQLSAINVQIEAPSGWEVYGGILLALLPILLIAVFFIFILRQAQGAGNQAFSFSKSKARMFTGDKPTVNFGDVAGNEEARQDLSEVVEFQKEPQKFASLGARIQK
ncbi:MAG: cell division protein FtsH, partial [Caldilineaceae bacterium SB0670_bin_27]|nr:cell division protein FtsH [Caldilineaceae bacterium SB0670_bin_27]